MKVHVMDYYSARAGHLAAVLEELGIPEVTTVGSLTLTGTAGFQVFIYDGSDRAYRKYIHAAEASNEVPRYLDASWMVTAHQIVRVQEPQMAIPENLFIVDISDIGHKDYRAATQHLSDYAEELAATLKLQHLKG